MKKYIITLIFSIFAIGLAVAQNTTYVGPLQLGAAYTDNQIIGKFGTPTEESTWEDEQAGKLTSFDYPNFSIVTGSWGVYSFVINPGCVYKINGLVGVGDSVSKLSSLQSGGTLQTGTRYGKSITKFFGRINGQSIAAPIVFFHNGSTITQITYEVLN